LIDGTLAERPDGCPCTQAARPDECAWPGDLKSTLVFTLMWKTGIWKCLLPHPAEKTHLQGCRPFEPLNIIYLCGMPTLAIRLLQGTLPIT